MKSFIGEGSGAEPRDNRQLPSSLRETGSRRKKKNTWIDLNPQMVRGGAAPAARHTVHLGLLGTYCCMVVGPKCDGNSSDDKSGLYRVHSPHTVPDSLPPTYNCFSNQPAGDFNILCKLRALKGSRCLFSCSKYLSSDIVTCYVFSPKNISTNGQK